MQYVITLVHGTFARGAGWTQPGSFLRSQIERTLEKKRVEFHVYEWSGRNDHDTRLSAGRELRVQLRGQSEANPEAQHFIIAHSHGGNVALYALRDRQVADGQTGLVCMGTPFINAVPRQTPAIVVFYIWLRSCIRWPYIQLTLFPVTYLGLLELYGFLSTSAGEFSWTNIFSWRILSNYFVGSDSPFYLGILSLISAVIFLGPEAKKRLKLQRGFSSRQLTYVRKLRAFKLAVPVLDVSVSGDEASLWLRLVMRIAARPYVLDNSGRNSVSTYKTLRELYPIVVACGIGLSLLLVGGLSLLSTSSDSNQPIFAIIAIIAALLWNLDLVMGVLLALAGIMATLMVALSWPAIVLFNGLKRGRAGLGGESITDNLLADVVITTDPQQARTVEKLRIPLAKVLNILRPWRVRHSMLYAEPIVIDRIVEFCRRNTGR